MNLEEEIGTLTKLSQKIKNQDSPVTPNERQAAVAMEEIAKILQSLFMEGMSIKAVFASLFYFWFNLDASLRQLSQHQIDHELNSLDETMEKIIDVVKSVIDNLPDHEPTLDMKKLGKTVAALKAHLPDEAFDRPLSKNELIRQATNVNTRIHTISSNLLMKESIHPEIVANVLFSNWIRLSTMHASVSEGYHQKIEFYFVEVINAVRKQIPVLFGHQK